MTWTDARSPLFVRAGHRRTSSLEMRRAPDRLLRSRPGTRQERRPRCLYGACSSITTRCCQSMGIRSPAAFASPENTQCLSGAFHVAVVVIVDAPPAQTRPDWAAIPSPHATSRERVAPQSDSSGLVPRSHPTASPAAGGNAQPRRQHRRGASATPAPVARWFLGPSPRMTDARPCRTHTNRAASGHSRRNVTTAKPTRNVRTPRPNGDRAPRNCHPRPCACL